MCVLCGRVRCISTSSFSFSKARLCVTMWRPHLWVDSTFFLKQEKKRHDRHMFVEPLFISNEKSQFSISSGHKADKQLLSYFAWDWCVSFRLQESRSVLSLLIPRATKQKEQNDSGERERAALFVCTHDSKKEKNCSQTTNPGKTRLFLLQPTATIEQ